MLFSFCALLKLESVFRDLSGKRERRKHRRLKIISPIIEPKLNLKRKIEEIRPISQTKEDNKLTAQHNFLQFERRSIGFWQSMQCGISTISEYELPSKFALL